MRITSGSRDLAGASCSAARFGLSATPFPGYNTCMPETQDELLSNAQATLTRSISFEEMLEKLSAKDRNTAEKHLLACQEGEGGERHAAVWQRLACTMTMLAPHAVKFGAGQSMLFYVPDGPYKMQVFALQDARDGEINVFCGNVLDEALNGKLLQPAGKADDDDVRPYTIADSDERLLIEELTGDDDLAPFCKHLVGWNRKALRVNLPATASDTQVEAAEQLCALTILKLRHEG